MTKTKTTKPSKPTTLKPSKPDRLRQIIADIERLYSSDDVKTALHAVLDRFEEESE
jgi:hypothetical protein